jgi:NADH ubiquinone oxidoreductase subunit
MTLGATKGGISRWDALSISEIDILWMTAGLGCDGDTIAVTAATQPSIEDLVLGAFPWIPKVKFHNPFLAYENGDEFVRYFRDAAEGKLAPFILVVEGSIPNESNKEEGYWASFGTDAKTGQPITTCDWIDQLAPKAWAVVAAGTCATYGGIHAMEGNPTGCMGLADYLGWDWKSSAGIPIVCVPGCPVQPDNFTEVLSYLLNMVAGRPLPGGDVAASYPVQAAAGFLMQLNDLPDLTAPHSHFLRAIWTLCNSRTQGYALSARHPSGGSLTQRRRCLVSHARSLSKGRPRCGLSASPVMRL